MLFRLLADATLLLHLAFIVFAVAGGVLALRWPRVVWAHLPAAGWAAVVMFTGWVCPLTPLENHFRALGGQAGYDGGFIENYIASVIYPDGITRGTQALLGAAVLLLNLAVYGWLLYRRRGRPCHPQRSEGSVVRRETAHRAPPHDGVPPCPSPGEHPATDPSLRSG
jgi:hypothetical protein